MQRPSCRRTIDPADELAMLRMGVKRPAVAGAGRVPEQPKPLPMLSWMTETAEPTSVETPVARGRRLAWSTAIFALATGLSRILGLIREVVAAYYFGASGKINAFTVAFQIPNLIRALVADAALSSAFVPIFSELLDVSGIVVGILNSYEHFSVPALTPVFWNVAIIVGLVVGVPQADSMDAELYVYAGSI